jgi:cytosine/adenosine deaminase-related metal-dependent hydrolase
VDHLTVDHSERAFEAAGETGIRGALGKVLMDRNSPDGLQEPTEAGLAETRELIEQYHGAFDDRVRYAVTPRFTPTCSEACLRGAREIADEYDGVRIHTHASEHESVIDDVTEERGMGDIEWLHEVGCTGDDVVLAHVILTSDREREILAETGTHVTYCPSSNMKVGAGIAPIVDYLDREINVALGNDGAPANNTLDPVAEMRQATLLQKVDHRDPRTLPAETVFRMATRNGAKAAGFENVGALREGWKADVVGITTDTSRGVPFHDPYSYLVYAANGEDVEFTMVDGEVLVADGSVTAVDTDDLYLRAREAFEDREWGE